MNYFINVMSSRSCVCSTFTFKEVCDANAFNTSLLLAFVTIVLPGLAHTKIIFKSRRDGGARLYVMDDNGRNVQQITTYNALWPVWSPDGKHIAFLKILPDHPKHGQQTAVFIIDSDGSNERRLTADNEDNLNGNRLFEGEASWSPDGQHIAFKSERGGAADIWTIHLITKKMRQLTRRNSLTVEPSWSPDSKYIAYRDKALVRGYPTIFIMRSDGRDQRELAAGDPFRFRTSPQWSPDSQSVVYCETTVAHVDGRLQTVSEKVVIHNIQTDNRRIVQTPDNWSIHSACFMGSRHLLIAAKGRDDNPDKYEIYRYNLITDEIVNLTNTPKDDFAMDWISDGVLPVTPTSKKK